MDFTLALLWMHMVQYMLLTVPVPLLLESTKKSGVPYRVGVT